MCVAPYCIIVDVFQPDAEYFKVDLPNSGEVILSKPLDYETKALLTVTIHASVINVHFLVSVSVYPHKHQLQIFPRHSTSNKKNLVITIGNEHRRALQYQHQHHHHRPGWR